MIVYELKVWQVPDQLPNYDYGFQLHRDLDKVKKIYTRMATPNLKNIKDAVDSMLFAQENIPL